MHYKPHPERQRLLELKERSGYKFPEKENRVLAFVNLAIHPYDFNQVYTSIRKDEVIGLNNWEAIKGVVMAMLVLAKRRSEESYKAVDAYTVDFIELIKSDRQGNASVFLLNMRWYMPRFLFVVGLQVSFGIDWKETVTNVLELKKKPQPTTYGSLFVNRYLRSFLYAYIVFKNYKQPGDEGYELGTNDINTLLDYNAKFAYAISRDVLVRLTTHLQEQLPAYSYEVRRKACYCIDNALDGYYILNTTWLQNKKNHEDVRYITKVKTSSNNF